jgi:ferredoxin-thioredoxin reductase catalytic subunit
MSEPSLRDKAAKLRDQLHKEAGAYHLNPDADHTLMLCEGLVTNLERYGYLACPCRLADGKMEADLDIVCPCDYRDPDLTQHGACYCALYVSEKVFKGEQEAVAIPERRPPEGERQKSSRPRPGAGPGDVQVFRCKVCGYLCAREEPPERCPICKAQKERFEPFPWGTGP